MQRCKSCGLCVAFCPRNAIRIGDRVNPQGYRSAMSEPSGCIGCGICLEVCPEPGVIAVHRADHSRGGTPARRTEGPSA